MKDLIEKAGPGKEYAGCRIDSIYLHVQTGNTSAREFYEQLGFRVVGEIPQYYAKLAPQSAWVLQLGD